MSSRKRSISILGCAGVISGILTIHPPLPRNFLPDVGIYVGVIFGIILAICLWVFYRPRLIGRAVAVVVSSTVAYIVAFFSTFWAYMFVPHPAFDFGTRNNTNPPSYVMFVGGVIGALILSTTVLLLYRDETTKLRQGIQLCTLGGGVLGVFGYSLGALFFGQDSKPGDIPGLIPLYVVWQAGMGCLLAAYLPAPVWVWSKRTRPSNLRPAQLDAPPPEGHALRIPLWGRLFIALLAASLVSYVARVTWVTHNFRRQQAEFTRYLLAHPTLQNLAPVAPMSNEQAVLLHPIADRTAQLLSRLNNAAIGNQPASVTFTACYMRLDYRCEANPADVKVQVSQWPGSRWSTYELEGMHYGNGAGYFTHPKRVQKFGNTIMADENPKDPGKGRFYWTSGVVLIVVESDVSDSDEFIREYLKRYPSSL